MTAAFLILAALSAAAEAQQPARPREASTAEAVRTLRIYSRCVVERKPEAVRALLAMDFRSDAYQAGMRRLALDERSCLRGGQLRFGGVLLAGNFAEALLPIILGDRTLAASIAGNATPPEARDANEEVAICVAANEPVAVSALLATEPASDTEREATRALVAPIQACVNRDTDARLNAPGIRAMLALASYRLVTQGGVTAPGNAN